VRAGRGNEGARSRPIWRIVRAVFGLFVGAFQLFIMVNACVRSIAGKWLLGSLGALLRTFLLIAVTMASARIRAGAAEPSAGFSVALFGGPALSLALLLLAFHRKRSMPAGSEGETAAGRLVTSWIAVAVIDAIFMLVGLAQR
jgi:hypothetical protein